MFGQLGLGAVKKQSKPKLVEGIAHEKVHLLCCGSFETVSLVRKRISRREFGRKL